ncbi:MAG: hypothetical protein ACYS7Y_04465 [Planctomycetota bacterium]|jgi:hypothetical protein
MTLLPEVYTVVITKELADSILEAEENCYSEGLGPVSDDWRLTVAMAERVAGRVLSHCEYLEPFRSRLERLRPLRLGPPVAWESGADLANAIDRATGEPKRSENFQLQFEAGQRLPSVDALFRRLYAGDRLPEGVAPELPDCIKGLPGYPGEQRRREDFLG